MTVKSGARELELIKKIAEENFLRDEKAAEARINEEVCSVRAKLLDSPNDLLAKDETFKASLNLKLEQLSNDRKQQIELVKSLIEDKIIVPHDIHQRFHEILGLELERFNQKISPRTNTPESPRGNNIDNVHFSISAPQILSVGRSHVIDVWTYFNDQRQELFNRIKDETLDGKFIIKSKGPVKVERGTYITVTLKLPGLIIDPPEETVLWEGEVMLNSWRRFLIISALENWLESPPFSLAACLLLKLFLKQTLDQYQLAKTFYHSVRKNTRPFSHHMLARIETMSYPVFKGCAKADQI